MKRTYVALLLDESGSMSYLKNAALQTLNGLIKAMRKRTDQSIYVTVVTFADSSNVILPPTLARKASEISSGQYRPVGSTALFDATGHAFELFDKMVDRHDPDTSFLVVAITDGEENASFIYNKNTLLREIEARQRDGNWTITFQVPKGYKQSLMRSFSIPEENIREWEATTAGMQELSQVTQSSMNTFFDMRAKGLRSVANFYAPVTTDLSKLSQDQLKQELTDLAKHFKSFTVDKEAVVKEFVETKTGKPYVVGQAYYQLMKREEIQPSKAVLIKEKDKKSIYGGAEARNMIGLPENDYAKVSPGNHANYDIFVQSTSVNRKLPRGTKVLVDLNQTQSMKPTWSVP